MMLKLNRQRRRAEAPAPRRTTAISFSGEDLLALGQLAAAGQVVLPPDGPIPPVLARLKAAMTRLGVPVPRGL